MYLQATFSIGSVFETYAMICSRLRKHTQQRRNRGCGADSYVVCSPVVVGHLLEDAVPGSGFCIGLSKCNVIFVREGAV